MEVKYIKIDKIKPNPWNPNRMSIKKLNGLKKSIQSDGCIIPIFIRQSDKDNFEIIDGEHRFNVCKDLEYKEIPCIVLDNTDTDAKINTLKFNMLKGENDEFKLSLLYTDIKENGYNLRELGEIIGETTEKIKNMIDKIKSDLTDEKFKEITEREVNKDAMIIINVPEYIKDKINEIRDNTGELYRKILSETLSGIKNLDSDVTEEELIYMMFSLRLFRYIKERTFRGGKKKFKKTFLINHENMQLIENIKTKKSSIVDITEEEKQIFRELFFQ